MKKLITIYSTSEMFGTVSRMEATLVETGKKTYAQYDNAPFIVYTPKRKRTSYIKRATYAPYILVLEGHNHPEPAGMFGAAKIDGNGTSIRESVYSSHDEQWRLDFDSKINSYMTENNITPLIDIRETVKTNIFVEVGREIAA